MGSDAGHIPVLLAETLELLAVRSGGLYVDGTVGLGGHAAAVLLASAPDGRLLGLGRDAETLERARARLAPFGGRARLEPGDFREIPERLAGVEPDGILLDLGISSRDLFSDQGTRFGCGSTSFFIFDPSGKKEAVDGGGRDVQEGLRDL